MKKKNSHALRMVAVLFAVCLLSASALGYVWLMSVDRIEENQSRVMEQAVYNVLPGIDEYSRISSDPLIFKGLSRGKVKGYALRGSGIGFQGEIELMIGVGENIERLTGVDVIKSVETPGLGDRIREEEFLKQFERMKISPDRKVEVDGITGATMSSDAVENIIRESIEDAKKRIH